VRCQNGDHSRPVGEGRTAAPGVLVHCLVAGVRLAGMMDVADAAAPCAADTAACLDQPLLGVVHPALADAKRYGRINDNQDRMQIAAGGDDLVDQVVRLHHVLHHGGQLAAAPAQVGDADVLLHEPLLLGTQPQGLGNGPQTRDQHFSGIFCRQE